MFLCWIIIFLFKKVVRAFLLRADEWMVSVSYGRCVQCLSVAKLAFLPYSWKSHCILFFLV
jgi:hypothetical protein